MRKATGAVGVIETRGIEPVPDCERASGVRGLFWLWFAANMGVLGITLGAALVSVIGLNLWQAILVTLVGALGSFALVGWLSTAGKLGGAPGLTLSRAVFGVRGNWGPTLVCWLGFVGWETVMCTTATFALLAVLGVLGVWVGVAGTVCCVLLVAAVAGVIGLFGHATILWVQKWLTWVFGAITVVVVVYLAVTADWGAALGAPAGPATSVIGAIGFIAAGTGIGWLAAGPDYTRYLQRSVPNRRVVLVTTAGAGIPLLLLIGLGTLMAFGDQSLASASDPVAAIGASLPDWMLVPYLVTAAFGLIAAADVSMYSSGLNLLAGGVRVRRTTAVIVDVVLIVLGSLYITVIAQDFFGPFSAFLTVLAVPLSGWAGVFLVDLRARSGYDADALLDTSAESRYWYSHGIHWPALASWLAGIVWASLFVSIGSGDQVWFAGPLAHTWLGQNSLGWLVSGVSAAAIYWVLEPLRHENSKDRPPRAILHEELARSSDD